MTLSPSLYQVALAPYIRGLQTLARLLDKAAEHAGRQGLDEATLVARRLHPEMFPLSRQVEILTSAARGTAARLARRLASHDTSPDHAVFNRGHDDEFGKPPPSSFLELQALIQEALAYLATVSASEVDDAAPVSVTVAKAGHVRQFDTQDFVLAYVLPNLYFHLTVVYALLRSAGVPLGKADYQGTPPYTLLTGMPADTPPA
ncbi:DUF1993 domain-containing protein [Caldimonas brevitalea]|uniref:DUF1993 domain-containing protein n=1 Tax=Caldimonas brevitalea TaxID=413882 RepID=A0A0G3BTJ9_9BURK|nr:DUF1993 domain-containing protein [Caldimonas brevitalea]AKJ29825.1 hypothetical protein AAW51_3134 [Caldimonas brevitalea]